MTSFQRCLTPFVCWVMRADWPDCHGYVENVKRYKRHRACWSPQGEGDHIYLSLHCHHQNDFCIKMGSEERHFNVSVGSDGQSHRTVVHKPQPFWRERRAEAVSNRGPSAYQPNALPLGQTGSLSVSLCLCLSLSLSPASIPPSPRSPRP